MVQKFDEYLFQEIGRRVLTARGNLSQEIFANQEMIQNASRVSQIEKGKKVEGRNYLSSSEIETLSKIITNGDQIALLFGDTYQRKELLSSILCTIALNGNKPIVNMDIRHKLQRKF
ncbi:hypothetical protein ACQTPQ_01145 [Streptococcus hyovaginalis]|uniref:hypothetical protein n=1 Tax=Streptococcus hyovaginalis TaxID=149015 RepID=UPI003AE1C0A6